MGHFTRLQALQASQHALLLGLRPARQRSQASSMQVSDLDGTMVGESPAADAATAAFSSYWENTATLAGGVLVYNTGRSLGQVQQLLESKQDTLALPNVVITAVGTKVGQPEFSAWAAALLPVATCA